MNLHRIVTQPLLSLVVVVTALYSTVMMIKIFFTYTVDEDASYDDNGRKLPAM
jgi:hypothetical protein